MLMKFHHRGQDSNVKRRELGVVFQDLRVQGLGTAASHQPTVGSVLNPMTVVDTIRALIHPPVRDIISGFEGVVNPGEMLCKYYLLRYIFSQIINK